MLHSVWQLIKGRDMRVEGPVMDETGMRQMDVAGETVVSGGSKGEAGGRDTVEARIRLEEEKWMLLQGARVMLEGERWVRSEGVIQQEMS